MAATLKWDGNALRLGRWELALVENRRWYINADPYERSEPYQDVEDAQQDCESEVRRLLKAAGVTVE